MIIDKKLERCLLIRIRVLKGKSAQKRARIDEFYKNTTIRLNVHHKLIANLA